MGKDLEKESEDGVLGRKLDVDLGIVLMNSDNFIEKNMGVSRRSYEEGKRRYFREEVGYISR